MFVSVKLLNFPLSFLSSSICDSSLDVFVIRRLLMFCAFELLDSSLFPPSTSILDSSAIELCCVGVSATARLLSICELPLPTTAVAAFIARLFLGSESGGIGTSFDSCGIANSPAALPTSSLLLTFLSTPFAIASFNTSVLQALRDPSGVVWRQTWILTGRSLSRSDRIATQASCSGPEGFNVCPGDPLCLLGVLLVCSSPRGT